ncbi:alpha/beta hydrolase [Stenotrophomonas sp.]|uniref:alpha/beta fold hydrolase n=1 Tax=Stenotrophomonas sp. TaxID=69392 RepID=UPI0028A6206D|nr:alpha/beta hydrolase [Stenotrophomonas sp.]
MSTNSIKVWAMAALLMAASNIAHAGEILVDRGAYRLSAEQSGAGPVTVVFESGFGQAKDTWKDVIAALGPDYRSISYSRAGLGNSGSDGKSKDIDAHLVDLGAVISDLAGGQKVVLVGHSYGGLLATEFARRHPQQLQALVLVDPATLGQRHAFKQADAARVQADDAALLDMLPPPMAADYRALITQLDAPGARTPSAMPDLPVALLTATQVAAEPFVFEETAAGKALWKAQHAALFSAFDRGFQRYFVSGHNIHRENPAAVADAIRDIAGRR